jgi:hypothetical protein
LRRIAAIRRLRTNTNGYRTQLEAEKKESGEERRRWKTRVR